jgi:hypothetical protein
MVYWPKPPQFSLLTDTATRFVLGFGLVGGGVWKFFNMTGGENYDHKMLGDGEHAPPKAKEAEKLLRRHSTHASKSSSELHPQAIANKVAA